MLSSSVTATPSTTLYTPPAVSPSSSSSTSTGTSGSLSADEAALRSAEQTLVAELMGGYGLAPSSAEQTQTMPGDVSISTDDTALDSAQQPLTVQLLGGDGPALSPAEHAQTTQMRDALLDPQAGSSSLLAQLTGTGYSASSPPDYLAVSTGAGVTPEYAGGYTSTGWDVGGAVVNFFATGQQPNVTKGFAVTFASDASPAQRQSTLAMAQSYLSSHVADSQNAAGAWNQPTFDVTVH